MHWLIWHRFVFESELWTVDTDKTTRKKTSARLKVTRMLQVICLERTVNKCAYVSVQQFCLNNIVFTKNRKLVNLPHCEKRRFYHPDDSCEC